MLYEVAPLLAVQDSETCALPATAVSPVGADDMGGSGVADASFDAAEVPPPLTAATV